MGPPPPGIERSPDEERTLRVSAAEAGLIDAKWVNRLVQESSPYLRQHATNPVDWFPWGEAALARAEGLDRLIFLSVGYSTCHWCHVMKRESFEDPEIAAFINTHFVPIKVDREERPDVDEVYLTAVQALSGRGGWPMTLVLTPDGKPLFAATYLPPRAGARGARAGLIDILARVQDAWTQDRAAMLSRAGQITDHLVRLATPAPPADVPKAELAARAAVQLLQRFDSENGGFGGAPKFPRPAALDLMLASRQPAATSAVVATLKAMGRGGIHDQLGGGFHRYATDAAWRVPHFEKMLYDNAQLLGTLTAAWQVTHDPELERLARRTAAYLLEQMRSPKGAFHSATDAESIGADGQLHEGAYFTWTPAELEATLDPTDAAFAAALWGIAAAGNLEGRAVPYLARGVQAGERARVEALRSQLLGARSRRTPPALDRKVIAAWNGYTISALARASVAFGEPAWTTAASRAAAFVLEQMRGPDGRLHRTWMQGTAQHRAVLEDEAAMAVALLDLFEATGERSWLTEAEARLHQVQTHFADPEGGWFRTPSDGEKLLVRHKPDHEGAEPSGTALAVQAMLRLAHLRGDAGQAWLEAADRALAAYSVPLTQAPTSMPALTRAVARRHTPPREVVVVWPDGADPSPLLAEVRTASLPFTERILAPASRVAAMAEQVPWVEGKVSKEQAPTAYVCEGGICQRPTGSPETLRQLLAPAKAAADEEAPAPPSARDRPPPPR